MTEIEPLLHIGYHKTATSWLQRRVFIDNAIGFSAAGPLRFIDDVFVRHSPFEFDATVALERLRPFIDEAEEKGTTLVVSQERLSGDPGQGSMDARSIADRLHAVFPKGRVLIVIREQRAMFVSFYKQVTIRGLRRERFDGFLERRIDGPGRPPFASSFEYHRLVEYYRGLFGPDRVLVLPYEIVRNGMLEFVGKIAKFCGLPQPQHVDMTPENVGLPGAAIAVARMVNVALHVLGLDRVFLGPQAKPEAIAARVEFTRKLGAIAPKSTSKRIERSWFEAADDYIGDRYVESNRITAALTGLDLEGLGYRT